ncbi:sensor histidine kinase [Saccharibacillus sacchari]|uniref:sensor histidine kinase n=1 Tax=Saccharibacillus sacchari TaxID=456493 RepID=UPI0004AD1727|nr:GHKL domain-containing protein [Saccharibacillus sacchari]
MMFVGAGLQFLIMLASGHIVSESRTLSAKNKAVAILFALFSGFLFQWIGVYVSVFMLLGSFAILYTSERDALRVLGGISYGALGMLLLDPVITLLATPFFPFGSQTLMFVYLVFLALCSLMFSLGMRRLKQHIRRKRNLDDRLKRMIVYLGAMLVVVYYLCIYLSAYIGETIELIQLNLFFFAVYLLIAFAAFFVYSQSLRKSYEVKQKEAEYSTMQRYTDELERQYTEIRKFRHDHQNILSSLDAFIQEEDFDGLKRYYREKLKRTSEHLESNNFKLENLSRIKVKEVKSLVAAKLIRAQELGIDATFEAKEEIGVIAADSVVLVRALGILLDNAIEELQQIRRGSMTVGMIQDRKAVHIIVQNDCRDDLPRVHKLKEAGFSTKGSNRGLGLANLTELIGQLPNAVSETVVEPGVFKQILVINHI